MAIAVALLGAESTGKTTLSHALAAALRAEGRRAAVVPEVLRGWCEREGRAPRPGEQLPIAREQERQVDVASLDHDIVIADTAAVMVLVYSGMLFEDDPLYRFAIGSLGRYDLVLLTGLDLPWTPDGLQRDAATREQVDAQLRGLLQQHGIPFRVVYGAGDERVAQALAPMRSLLGQHRAQPAARWQWSCEKCSDPDCEHRLFAMLRKT